MSENILIGKILTGIKISRDRQAILFETVAGGIVVGTDADCCSHTWVEHIELPALGFPAVVLSVTDLDMPSGADSLYETNTDVVAYYGCKIITDRGEIVIDYRNDSNGYYGGNLTWPGEHYYGDVYGQQASSNDWVEVSA